MKFVRVTYKIVVEKVRARLDPLTGMTLIVERIPGKQTATVTEITTGKVLLTTTNLFTLMLFLAVEECTTVEVVYE